MTTEPLSCRIQSGLHGVLPKFSTPDKAQPEWELREFGDARKEVVANLFIRRYLGGQSESRGIDAARDAAREQFRTLVFGARLGPRAW